LLFWIWITAILIAGVALAVMVVLVVLRVITDRRAARREARRQALLAAILAWLDGSRSGDEIRRDLKENRSVATTLLIEIFELVRGEDQQRLARIAEEAKLPRYLRETIEIGAADERLSAAESLVWFPSEETRAILLFALNDRDGEVSLAAASSLAQLGEPLPIRQFLERRLGQTAESSRQLEAVLARVAIRQREDLLDVARDEALPDRLRAAAIDALGHTGSFDLLEPLEALADAPSALIRAAVCRALGSFGHPGAEAAIVRRLDDADWEVRAEAAEATGRIGLVGIMARLVALLSDENWWVRFRAGMALAALGERGTGQLRQVAADNADASGRMASLILAEKGLP
jgi:HEAT repeat protein